MLFEASKGVICVTEVVIVHKQMGILMTKQPHKLRSYSLI